MQNDVLKILFVITGLRIGGAEKLLLLTCKWLKTKYAVDIKIVYFDPTAPMLPYFESIDITCSQMNRNLTGVFKLIKYISNEKFDIVHTHLIHADIFGRLAAFVAKSQVVYSTAHGVEWFRTRNSIYCRMIRRIDVWASKPKNSFVIAISNSVRNVLEQQGIHPNKIKLLPNAIEINKDLQRARKYNGQLKLLYVGRLSFEKNVSCLIHAFYKVRDLDVSLTIVGDGDCKKRLEALVNSLNLNSKVLFAGAQYDIENFYLEHDVLVLPSLNEGLGIVILEAFDYGLAVIGSNVDGITELLSDNRGVLFKSNDHQELAKKILLFYNNPDLIQSFKDRGKKYVSENHNIETYTEKLYSFYKESLE